MTKEIPLTHGLVTIVDDEDYEWLSAYKWYPSKARDRFYASRKEMFIQSDGRKGHRSRQMQQDILYPEQKCSLGMKADHQNRNPLDNRRCNLRLITDSLSNINREWRKVNYSGYRGVFFNGNTRKFVAKIKILGDWRLNGTFSTAEEAARAYNSLARLHHGTDAQLNLIPDNGPQFLEDDRQSAFDLIGGEAN